MMFMVEAERDAALQDMYPWIAWGEPILVSSLSQDDLDDLPSDPGVRAQAEARQTRTHYACRLCIAHRGLRGQDVEKLPTDIEVVRQHIADMHVIVRRAAGQ